MDNILINAHSILRWAVILFGLYAIIKSARGLLSKQSYSPSDNLSATLFVASVHLQILIGLLLYIARGWANNLSKMGEIMGDSTLRFWTIEHIFGMLVAAVLIQVGRTKSKKANQDAKKHRLSLFFFTLGLLLIIAMIPWPFRGEIARSLWP